DRRLHRRLALLRLATRKHEPIGPPFPHREHPALLVAEHNGRHRDRPHAVHSLSPCPCFPLLPPPAGGGWWVFVRQGMSPSERFPCGVPHGMRALGNIP